MEGIEKVERKSKEDRFLEGGGGQFVRTPIPTG